MEMWNKNETLFIIIWESHENKFCSLYSKWFSGLDGNEKQDLTKKEKEISTKNKTLITSQ